MRGGSISGITLAAVAWGAVAAEGGACALTSGDDPHAHEAAVRRVLDVPRVMAWMKAMPPNVRVVIDLGRTDRQLKVNGRCYWQVSLFEGWPDRVPLWRSFLVGINGMDVLAEDPDGDFIPATAGR